MTINNARLISFCQWDAAVCKAAGGVWDSETSKCAPAYNCFVAGFCAQGAKMYPPSTYGYTNVHEGAKPDQGAALAAGCDTIQGGTDWQFGEFIYNQARDMEVFRWRQGSGPCAGN